MNAGIFSLCNALNTPGQTVQAFDPGLPTAAVPSIYGLQPNFKPMDIEVDTRLAVPGYRGQAEIPLPTTNVSAVIDWGDGNVEVYRGAAVASHKYNDGKHYRVRIWGSVPSFGNITTLTGKTSVTKILDWGGLASRWTGNYGNLCYGLANLEVVPPYLPVRATSLAGALRNLNVFDSPNVLAWDVSAVTSFANMFQSSLRFNQRIGQWQMGAAAASFNVSAMFTGASSFNQQLSAWDMSKCTSCSSLFNSAANFNSDISGWNLASCTAFDNAFLSASRFNQPIDDWTLNTSSSFVMNSMFQNAASFNQPLNNWNMSKCTNTSNMFLTAAAFNQPLNNWNMSTCTNTSQMFQGATVFNSSLAGWDLSACTNMSFMFYAARDFNQSINDWTLNTTSGVNINGMFQRGTAPSMAFNQPLNNWNVSKVTTMQQLFSNNAAFNSSLANWNVSSCTDFQLAFTGATAFNQSLATWTLPTTVSYTMANMFNGAAGIQQSFAAWNLAKCTSLGTFLSNGNIGTAAYDDTLVGWDANKLSGANGVANWATNLTPHFGSSKYTAGSAAATARAALVTYGWTITDGGTA